MNYLLTAIREHPFTLGIISSLSTMFVGIIGLLSEEGTVRFIASIGGLFGITLTLLSIYYKIRKGSK